MVESAGAYGPWFEWKGFKEPKPTRRQLLVLGDQNLVDKDPRLYLERLAYRKECQRIFRGLSITNFTLGERIAIPVNTPSLGDGLLLRETFEEKPAPWMKPQRKAFLITENTIFKVGPLTPSALGKAEKAVKEARLKRLELACPRSTLRDVLIDNDEQDGARLKMVVRKSFEKVAQAMDPQERAAKAAFLKPILN